MTNFDTTYDRPWSEPVPSKPARLLTSALSAYQRLRVGRIAPCRFYPSCSQYAIEALTVHGAARGSWYALRGVLRCRPFGPHGIDLVPESSRTRSPDL